jgi:hypothetical protein
LKLIDQNGFDITLLEPLSHKFDYSSKVLEETDVLAELSFDKRAENDRKSWLFQQIDHLAELTEKYISLQKNTKSLKTRFHQIHQILGE